jgi:hypothetical protein
MAKPRSRVTRRITPETNLKFPYFEAREIKIAAWCPDPVAREAPEQVHMLLSLDGLPPILMRFKSPDTLGFLVEELARYRRYVWPEAEPLDLANDALEESGGDG